MRQERIWIAGAALVLIATACNDASSITGPKFANATPAFDLASGPIALDVPWVVAEENPCNGDAVTGQGKTHIVFHSSLDASGGTHDTFDISHSGSGVGLPTGSNYRVVDKTITSEQDPDGPQVNYKEEHQIVMAAPKPAINYTRHVLIKLTINADGEPTADFAWMFNKCNGNGDKVDVEIP
jgi:hypothetical protein